MNDILNLREEVSSTVEEVRDITDDLRYLLEDLRDKEFISKILKAKNPDEVVSHMIMGNHNREDLLDSMVFVGLNRYICAEFLQKLTNEEIRSKPAIYWIIFMIKMREILYFINVDDLGNYSLIERDNDIIERGTNQIDDYCSIMRFIGLIEPLTSRFKNRHLEFIRQYPTSEWALSHQPPSYWITDIIEDIICMFCYLTPEYYQIRNMACKDVNTIKNSDLRYLKLHHCTEYYDPDIHTGISRKKISDFF